MLNNECCIPSIYFFCVYETLINSSYEVFSSKLASTTSKNDNVSGEKTINSRKERG